MYSHLIINRPASIPLASKTQTQLQINVGHVAVDSLRRVVVDSLNVVADGVRNVRGVVVGVVLGANAGSTVVLATGGKRGGVEGIDDTTVCVWAN